MFSLNQLQPEPKSKIDYKKLFLTAPEPYLILDPSNYPKEGFKIIEVNEAYLRATITKREEIIGRDIFEVFPENPQDLESKGVENLRTSLENVLAHKRADPMAIQKYDIPRPQSMGGGFEVRYWSPINTPVLDENNKVAAIIHRVKDVTEYVHMKQSGLELNKTTAELRSNIERMQADIVNRELERASIKAENKLLLQEIQARKEAETKLLKSQQELNQAINLLYVALQASQGGSFNLDLVNQKFNWGPLMYPLFHTTPERFDGSFDAFLAYVHPDDRRLLNIDSFRAFRSDRISFLDFRIVLPNGIIQYMSCRGKLITKNEGNDRHVVGTCFDVTQQKLQEQEHLSAIKQEAYQRARAEDAETTKVKLERFIDTICHEVRNPTNGILGNSELLGNYAAELALLIKELPDDHLSIKERATQVLNLIKQTIASIASCTKHQIVIINDVVQDTKLEAQKVQLNVMPFHIKETLTSIVHSFDAEFHKKKLKCILEMPEEDLILIGDPNRLVQIMFNLLTNSIRNTFAGYIEMTARYHKLASFTDVEITIKDTGIGMAEDQQFDLFNRNIPKIFKGSAEYNNGAGLGLLITKDLIELMNGNIKVESKKWKGTTVKFVIRCNNFVKEEQHILSGITKEVASVSKQASVKKILIVEDNLLNQKILKTMLTRAGYECQTADNGQEGVTLYQKNKFDLIFMDIEMPIMTGFQAATIIRINEQQANVENPTPIICLSGYARSEFREQAFAAGMDDYICKPFDKNDLLAKVEFYTTNYKKPTDAAQPVSAVIKSRTSPKSFLFHDKAPRFAQDENNTDPKFFKKPKPADEKGLSDITPGGSV